MKRFILPALLLIFSNILKFASVEIEYIPEGLLPTVQKSGEVLFVVSIAWGLIAFIRLAKHHLLKQHDLSLTDNLRSRKIYTQFNILEKIIVFIIIIISVGVVLMLFEGVKNIGVSLFASAGVAGIIIGLSAQKALGTILAGLQIAITQPIRNDDVVIVENEWGWVEEINLTYVVIRIWDKRRLVVPSTYFLENAFQNWTRTSADILGTVYLYTDYTMPIEPLRKELTRLLESNDHWDGKVNVMQVTDAKENTLEIRALMSAATSPSAWDLRVYVREKLVEFLQKQYPECLPKTRIEMDKNDFDQISPQKEKSPTPINKA